MSAVSFLGSQAMESGVLSSGRLTLTSGGSANTKGSYVQAIASTSIPGAWVLLSLSRPTVTATDLLVDVAVGGAGSEQVVIPNTVFSVNALTTPAMSIYLLPLHIPAGSRVALRAQSAGSSDTIDAQITIFAPMAGGEKGLERVEACGALTATSLGTVVDSGGTAHTKGAWSELIAATTHPYHWVCLSLTHEGALSAGTSYLVDLGIGGAGSEVVVVPNLAFYGGSTSDCMTGPVVCFPLHIPAGTRVAARSSCGATTSPDRVTEAVLHGVG